MNAFLRLSASSTSPATTSAPSFASSFAFSELTSRVMARAAKPPLGSARIALTSPLPCAPVAPTTAMIFLSAMVFSFWNSSEAPLLDGRPPNCDSISILEEKSL